MSAPEKLKRPALLVTACLVHGEGLFLYIADETISSGSDWTCEITLRSLELVCARHQRRGRPFPEVLIIQADDTTKEVKNSIFSGVAAALTSAELFRAVSVQHLRVGHTHEDVDALLGIISGVMHNATDSLQDPSDIVRLLQSQLEDLFAGRGEECRVEQVFGARPFGSLLPKEVSLKGAYMSKTGPDGIKVEAPHSFTFVARAGPNTQQHC
jgi:hypothetical protein